MMQKPFKLPDLPPELDYSAIFPNIIKARDIVARFDEAVKRLPNPEIIQRTFETKEAVLSSKIEGTQTNFEEVLLYDAQIVGTKNDTVEIDEKIIINPTVAKEIINSIKYTLNKEIEKKKDYIEISNYRLAILKGKEYLEKRPLSENLIKDLHKILLNSARGQNKAPGEFRKNQVFIGPYGASIDEARFIPPPPQEIPRLFSNFEKYLHSTDEVDPFVKIAIAHYQFEAIHPFLDGNGRIGRLLVPLFIYEKKITAYPNVYVSEFLEKNCDVYYDLLNAVSEKKEWVPWVRFFLEAIQKQTELTLQRVIKIEKLYKDLKEKMQEINSIYANSFLDALFVKPRFTVKAIKKLSGVTNTQTLYTLIDKFLEADIIIDSTPHKERNKYYAFDDLIKIVK